MHVFSGILFVGARGVNEGLLLTKLNIYYARYGTRSEGTPCYSSLTLSLPLPLSPSVYSTSTRTHQLRLSRSLSLSFRNPQPLNYDVLYYCVFAIPAGHIGEPLILTLGYSKGPKELGG